MNYEAKEAILNSLTNDFTLGLRQNNPYFLACALGQAKAFMIAYPDNKRAKRIYQLVADTMEDLM